MNTVFIFPGMLLNHVDKKDIKIPDDLENYNREEYPHWYVFAALHLGYTIDVYSLKHNAKIIGQIPDDKIRTITPTDLFQMGVEFSYNSDIV